MAAPRRTGKSTFLQGDLKPALEQQGIVVIYVDLWADLRRDPGILIAEGIARALKPQLGLIARTAKAAGLENISIGGWLKIDTSKIGQIDGATLPEALRALHEAAKVPVALIIDEAQHALTSEAGETAMAALKSARDQINSPDRINLMLVMSGSDRDKLLRLVNTNGAPFYGSQIQRMPLLDTDFIAHIARLIEAQRPELVPVDHAVLLEAQDRNPALHCRFHFLFGVKPLFETPIIALGHDMVVFREQPLQQQEVVNALTDIEMRLLLALWPFRVEGAIPPIMDGALLLDRFQARRADRRGIANLAGMIFVAVNIGI